MSSETQLAELEGEWSARDARDLIAATVDGDERWDVARWLTVWNARVDDQAVLAGTVWHLAVTARRAVQHLAVEWNIAPGRVMDALLPDDEGLAPTDPAPNTFSLDAAPADIPVGGVATATGTTAAGEALAAMFIRHQENGPAVRALLTADEAEALAEELRHVAALIREAP